MAKEKDPVYFCYHLVAFFDVLNQADTLKNLRTLPNNEKEKQEFIETLKQSFGVVSQLRRGFQKLFDEHKELLIKQEKKPDLPQEVRTILGEAKKTEIRLWGFADTTVIYVPVGEQLGQVPISAVFTSLVSIGEVFLAMLSKGYPCRAGVEVGLAAEFYENEIYGPALSEAYRLESQVAQYPRIIVGEQLRTYLAVMKNSEAPGLVGDFHRRMADACLKMLVQDIDGHPILDYLGKGFMNVVEYLPLQDNSVHDAYEFVKKEAQKWKEQKDTKLSLRYRALGDYFESRLTVLQAEISKTKK